MFQFKLYLMLADTWTRSVSKQLKPVDIEQIFILWL